MLFKKKTLAVSCSLFVISGAASVSAQEVEWSVETGLGYETNVYHAPDHDYIDTALPSTRPAGIAVSPEEISSFFIPVEAEVNIRNKVYDNADFVAGLGFDTDVMLNSDADDATRTNVKFDLGFDYELVKWKFSKKKNDYIKRKRGDAYIGAFFSTHDNVYVDRDTGEPKTTSGGIDISDKYSYQSFGLKGDYERKVGKFEYLFGFIYKDLNYDTPLSGDEYDHIYNKFEFGIKRDFTKATDLKAIYRYSVRDYSDRRSRDLLTGTYSSANDLVKYTYNAFLLKLTHRFDKKFKASFAIENTDRTDEFEGYNDYSRLDMSLRARYKYSSATKIRGKIAYSTTDYANAYNFDDATRGNKENSGLDLKIKVEQEMNKNKLYYIELDYTDRESTDDRYDYTNNIIMLGAKWKY